MHQDKGDYDYLAGDDEAEDDFIGDELTSNNYKPAFQHGAISNESDSKKLPDSRSYSGSTSDQPSTPSHSGSTSDQPSTSSHNFRNESRSAGGHIQPQHVEIDASAIFSSSTNNSNYTTTQTVVNKQQNLIAEQAKILLNLFIQQQARETPVEPIIHRLCEVDRGALMHCGLNDPSLNGIMHELLKIAAEVSENHKIETFIETVPICATRQVFFDVAYKVFADGTINWGRLVMVFYFGCRLVLRSLSQTVDNSGWVKEMLTWIIDFIMKNFGQWIMRRGGWAMIKEWTKFNDNVWRVLCFGSFMFAVWAYFGKS